jgi:hypothetical protein
MNEEPRRLQVGITGEIEIVDPRALEGGCLLWADVRREEQDPVTAVLGKHVCSAAVQLFDDDPDILVAEMSLLFNKVANGASGGLPGDNSVEMGQGLPECTDLGPGYPLLESGPVGGKVVRSR